MEGSDESIDEERGRVVIWSDLQNSGIVVGERGPCKIFLLLCRLLILYLFYNIFIFKIIM